MKKYLIASSLVVAMLVSPLGAQASTKHVKSNKKDGWVQFEPGSAKLSKTAKFELRLFAKANKKATSFKVTGYVQKAGSDANNKKLSKARAKSVRKYLRKIGVTVPITEKGAKVPKKWGKKASARRAVIKAVNSGSSDSESSGPQSCPNPTFDPTQYWVTETGNADTATDGNVEMTLKLSPKDAFTTADMPTVPGCEVSLQWSVFMGDMALPLSGMPGNYPYEPEVTVGDISQTSVNVGHMSQMSNYFLYYGMCAEQAFGVQVLVGTQPYFVRAPQCDQPWVDLGMTNGITTNDISFSYQDPWGQARSTDLDANRIGMLTKPGTGINVTFNTANGYQVTIAETDGNLSAPPNGSPIYYVPSATVGSHWTDTDSTTLPATGTDRWYVFDYMPS